MDYRAIKLLPSDQLVFDPSPIANQLSQATEIIVEIAGGEGGDDSKLFVQNLFAGLCKYARRHGLKSTILSSATGHITAKFMGPRVWQLIEPQIGTHCVQRVPPTESRGRRHTSYLAVAAFPVIEFKSKPALPPHEIEVKTQRGTGPGGQHQNKTDSAVRMVHLPTGTKVFINGRDQHANRAEALRVLTARVHDLEQQATDAKYRELRKSQLGNAGRGKKIRTYNYVNDRAVDHRTGAKAKVRRVVEKGEFELMD